ncbi:hypothetical protein EUTSA_v10023103mg [Eutrema salsugineum]|uniref:Defensin-like domain-containing protein n=1 Tax=Eutrema salsugineum TaxID=72664 RepID=V4MEV4_EUTSA|nr:hypothetical protein EUTSA_v10023103mg [Eutrema salsugineum]
MSYTQILVILVLVVILDVSLSTQNTMASEVKATNRHTCFHKCTRSYDMYECNVDCIYSGYNAGECHSLFPTEPKYCCCF